MTGGRREPQPRPLRGPGQRQAGVAHERGGRQRGRLPALDDGGDDVRSQVAQPQQAGDIGGGHLLGLGELLQREIGGVRQSILDREGPQQQPDQARVQPGDGRLGMTQVLIRDIPG